MKAKSRRDCHPGLEPGSRLNSHPGEGQGLDAGLRQHDKLAYLIATFFKTGCIGPAPGTLGSLASLIIWAPIVLWDVHYGLRLFAVILVFLIGWRAFERSKHLFSESDPKEVVIDEVAGMGIALIYCPPTWYWILIAFVLFRIFDILKPWPISWVDKNMKTPLGVMVDDMIAGIVVAFLLGLVSL